jgi:cysteine synthase A
MAWGEGRPCHDDAWAAARGLDWRPYAERLRDLLGDP